MVLESRTNVDQRFKKSDFLQNGLSFYRLLENIRKLTCLLLENNFYICLEDVDNIQSLEKQRLISSLLGKHMIDMNKNQNNPEDLSRPVIVDIQPDFFNFINYKIPNSLTQSSQLKTIYSPIKDQIRFILRNVSTNNLNSREIKIPDLKMSNLKPKSSSVTNMPLIPERKRDKENQSIDRNFNQNNLVNDLPDILASIGYIPPNNS